MGYLEGFYYNPRIDKQILREHSEGLIGLTACLGGEIAQTLEKNGVAAAEEAAQRVQGHLRAGRLLPRDAAQRRCPSRTRSTASSMRMSQEARHPARRHQRLPLRQARATRAAHEVLMCDRRRQDAQGREAAQARHRQLYVKRRRRWTRYFKDIAARRWRTPRSIARACATSSSSSSKTYLPKYKVPDGDDARHATWRELVERGPRAPRSSELTERGDKFDARAVRDAAARCELGVIQKMGFSGYFLIVWDFIN